MSTLALGITLWGLRKEEREKLALSNSGKISSNSKNITYPCLIFGSNRFEGNPEGFNIIDLSNGLAIGSKKRSEDTNSSRNKNDKIIVWTDNGQLKASATVKDREGRVLARIIGNEWETASRPLIFDKNFDNNALEVVDAYGNVVLQVNMISSCARISGVFYNQLGTIVINDSALSINPTTTVEIDPIFIYPSVRHQGKRINN